FWYKVNASPDRGGIITINDNNDNSDQNRNQGLRIFREGNASKQRIKLNLGVGTAESWNDGGEINVDGNWVYITVTISPTQSKIYFNNVLQNTSTYTKFDFSTSSTMVVGSGAPSFSYWNHLSDLSLIDDLRVFDKVLAPTDIQNLMQ
ncbi:MAG: LamG-like jellyroll fold domain-containing protein, partial [Chryseobacterium sp.]